jgi:hypothetical protein
MVVFDNSILCLVIHPAAKPRTEVDRPKDRIDYLMERLRDDGERIILPTPAVAEFLILAGTEGPQYLSLIRDNSIFRIEPFDERAAIELADIELTQRRIGNKRGSATDSDWQKVKFDRQIVAVAKVHGVRTIYSDDPHIKKHGEDCGLNVVRLGDLPLPSAVQQSLELTAPEHLAIAAPEGGPQ